MSDLDSTGARTTAAPISNLALGKLRSLGGRGQLAAGDDSLLADAFADVFANIAAAQPIQTDNTVTSVDESNKIDTQGSDEGHQDQAEQVENDTTDDGQHSEQQIDVDLLGPQLVRREDTEEVQIDTALVESDIDIDQDDLKPAVIPVEVKDEVTLQETGTSERVVTELTDLRDRKRDRQQQSGIDLELVTGPQLRRGAEDSFRVEDLQGGLTPKDDGLTLDPTLQQSGQGEGDQTPGRSRRRGRRTSGIEIPQQNGTQHKQEAANQQAKPIVAAEAAAEALADSLAHNDPTDGRGRIRSTNHRAAAAVTHLQTTPSGRSVGTAASQNPGSTSRPSVQPIDASNSVKDVARPKTDASKAANNRAAETVSRVKLIQRVSKAFQHLGPEGGVVRLRLAPAEMGTVRVEMRIHQRKIEARVVAESEAAGSALREHLTDLRQRLESQGMQIERLEIETEQSQSELSNPFGQRHRDRSDDRQHHRWQQSTPQRDTPDKPAPPSRVSRQWPVAGGLASSNDGIDVRL